MQLAAGLDPARFFDAACVFMLPYKAAAVAALLWYREELDGAERVAVQWAIPLGVLVVLRARKH